MRRAAWFLGASLLGCAHPAEPARASKIAPAPSASAPAPVVVAAKPAEPAPPAAPVAPPKPSVAELTRNFEPQALRTLDVVRHVCPAALQRDGERVRIGCRSCPPFGANAATPDIAVEPDEFYEVEAAYFGNFTSPTAREAALVMNGCEPHSANYGGTLLVEWDGTAWSEKTYAVGFRPSECRLFTRPDRRDLLLCIWRSDHQMYARSGAGSFDFTRIKPDDAFAGWENLIAVEDNSYSACLDPPEMKRSLVADEITALDVDPQRKKLAVDVRVFHGQKSEAYAEKCAELIKSADSDTPVDVHAALKFGEHRLSFSWQGAGFVPDAATRALVRRVWVPAASASARARAAH